MDLGLKGRVALVTGGARGIGRAEADALAQEGAVIAVADLNLDAAREAAASIRGFGVDADAFAVDVSDEGQCGEVVAAVMQRFGRLDILVNNAGVGMPYMGKPVLETTAEMWDRMIAVHMRGTFLMTRAAARPMMAAGWGRIVNTSSMNYTGGGRPGVANYAAAKAGIAGFTRTTAKELGGSGITVNAIAPGYVETDLIRNYPERLKRVMIDQNPIGRLGRPEEVGAAVAFLCSTKAAFINGALIQIDGGKQDFHWG